MASLSHGSSPRTGKEDGPGAALAAYGWIPATQVVPFQYALEPSRFTMYWPAVQLVPGEAVSTVGVDRAAKEARP
jgi:hypothetical protein